MAIIEGGVRFPLDQFMRKVLRELTFTSSQLSTNSYRIIMSIIEPRRTENLSFGIEELVGAYQLGKNTGYGLWAVLPF